MKCCCTTRLASKNCGCSILVKYFSAIVDDDDKSPLRVFNHSHKVPLLCSVQCTLFSVCSYPSDMMHITHNEASILKYDYAPRVFKPISSVIIAIFVLEFM